MTSLPRPRSPHKTALTICACTAMLLAVLPGAAHSAKDWVLGSEIKDGTITSKDIANKSITYADMKAGSLPEGVLTSGANNGLLPRLVEGSPVKTAGFMKRDVADEVARVRVPAGRWLLQNVIEIANEIPTNTQGSKGAYGECWLNEGTSAEGTPLAGWWWALGWYNVRSSVLFATNSIPKNYVVTTKTSKTYTIWCRQYTPSTVVEIVGNHFTALEVHAK